MDDFLSGCIKTDSLGRGLDEKVPGLQLRQDMMWAEPGSSISNAILIYFGGPRNCGISSFLTSELLNANGPLDVVSPNGNGFLISGWRTYEYAAIVNKAYANTVVVVRQEAATSSGDGWIEWRPYQFNQLSDKVPSPSGGKSGANAFVLCMNIDRTCFDINQNSQQRIFRGAECIVSDTFFLQRIKEYRDYDESVPIHFIGLQADKLQNAKEVQQAREALEYAATHKSIQPIAKAYLVSGYRNTGETKEGFEQLDTNVFDIVLDSALKHGSSTKKKKINCVVS
jgi:hypothetical protein